MSELNDSAQSADRMEIITAINVAAENDIVIYFTNNFRHQTNSNLCRLVKMRKDIAYLFIKTTNPKLKQNLINQFILINQNIIALLGLGTKI